MSDRGDFKPRSVWLRLWFWMDQDSNPFLSLASSVILRRYLMFLNLTFTTGITIPLNTVSRIRFWMPDVWLSTNVDYYYFTIPSTITFSGKTPGILVSESSSAAGTKEQHSETFCHGPYVILKCSESHAVSIRERQQFKAPTWTSETASSVLQHSLRSGESGLLTEFPHG